MKRVFPFLLLAVSVLGLANCSSRVESTRSGVITSETYVTGPVYRTSPTHHHGPYYGSVLYSPTYGVIHSAPSHTTVFYRNSDGYTRHPRKY